MSSVTSDHPAVSAESAGRYRPIDSAIAELHAVAAGSARIPLQKALRKAARKALFWEEEAADIVRQRRTLMELPGVGQSLTRIMLRWIAPQGFLTLPNPCCPSLSRSLPLVRYCPFLLSRTGWLLEVQGSSNSTDRDRRSGD